MRHIPGPTPSWMIGNLADIVRMGKHEAFSAWSRQYGKVYKVFEGGVMTVVVQDASLGRWINARMPNRHPIPYMEIGEEERFNAAGILFARGVHHRGLRAAWQPMFHSGSLQNFMGIMDHAVSRLITILDDAAENKKEVDIWRLFGDLTIQISGTTAFGIDMTAHNGSSELVQAAKAFFDAAGQIENIYALLQVMFPCVAPAVRVLANVIPTASYRRAVKGRQTVRAAVSQILLVSRNNGDIGINATTVAGKENTVGDNEVGKKRGDVTASTTAQDKRNNNNDIDHNNNKNSTTTTAQKSFLDLISRSINKETGQSFTDMEVICQAFSFILAAYETSSAALAFAVYLLAIHPDAMLKVHDEIDRFFADKQEDGYQLSLEDLACFPYVDAVFKETLRLYPTVPLTIRQAEKDLELPKSGCFIPAGTHIAVCVYGLHHSKEYWKDPECFRPERFLVGGDAAYDAYMPFGEGVRGCIGQKYAWQEIVLTLVRLYRRFKFVVVGGGGIGEEMMAVRMSLSLTPKRSVMVGVVKRR